MAAQSTTLLKSNDSLLSGVTVLTDRGYPGVEVSSDRQATLEVPDRLTAVPGPQDEGLRNSSNSCNSWPLPFAPTIRLRSSPLWNTSNVGILMTLKRMAISP